jgi:hypothetical protein
MSVQEAHRSLQDQPDWIQSLGRVLSWCVRLSIWPTRWRQPLQRSADDVLELAIRWSTRRAHDALKFPEQLARDVLVETDTQAVAPAAQDQAASSERSGTAANAEPRIEVEPPRKAESPAQGSAADPGAVAPAPEVFLEQLRRAAEEQSDQVEQELTSLRRQEKTVFSMLLVAAGLALLLLVTGAALIFTGLATVGVLSALVGLVPGSGTLVLRRLEQRVARDKQRVAAIRERNLNLLQAIQVTLLIEDPAERGRSVSVLASNLTTSALGQDPASTLRD